MFTTNLNDFENQEHKGRISSKAGPGPLPAIFAWVASAQTAFDTKISKMTPSEAGVWLLFWCQIIEIHRTLPPQELKSWPTIHFLKLSSLSMTWYPDVEVPRDGSCSLWALGENETSSFHTYCSVKIQYATVKTKAKHQTWLDSLNVALVSRNVGTEGWVKSRRRTCHLV